MCGLFARPVDGRSSLLPPVPAELPLLPVAAQAASYRKDLPNLSE